MIYNYNLWSDSSTGQIHHICNAKPNGFIVCNDTSTEWLLQKPVTIALHRSLLWVRYFIHLALQNRIFRYRKSLQSISTISWPMRSTLIYFWSKVNIWNVNCARATAFIFDTRTGVLGKVQRKYFEDIWIIQTCTSYKIIYIYTHIYNFTARATKLYIYIYI